MRTSILILVCLFIQFSFVEAKLNYNIKYVNESPVIDGTENDTCWQGLEEITNFIDISTDDFAEIQTHVKICYDNNNIYFLFIFDEPTPNLLTAICTINDTDEMHQTDDTGEIHLDTNLDMRTHYQIMFNSKNMITDTSYQGSTGRGDNRVWNSNAEAKTTILSDKYITELKIPFSSLKGGMGNPPAVKSPPNKGTIWGIDVCRNRKVNKVSSDWSGTKNFNGPGNYYTATFMGDEKSIETPSWGEIKSKFE